MEHISLDELRIDLFHNTEERMDEDYGRFAWVCDPEGNKIELWEPK